MSAASRIGIFAALLALVFAAAALAGSALDPDVEPADSHDEEDMEMNAHADTATAAAASLPGLAVADAGFRMVVDRTELAPDRGARFTYRIAGPAGVTVTDFDVEHERRMHLILVRRDMQNFHHLHPRQREDGSWAVDFPRLDPGAYRVFADFSSGGTATTLGSELVVPGDFRPEPLAEPSAEAHADLAEGGDAAHGDEEYSVRVSGPAPTAGSTVPFEFTVSRNGRPVDGVEPYLGADGHLVALREGDLAYLHTHPEGEPGGPGPIRFQVEYPSAGRYRLFLQFKHAGEVRTAAFTQVAGEQGSAPAPVATDDHGEGH
jgi:hypothetical protein